MNEVAEYITDVAKGVKTLLKGLSVTGYYFFHPKEILTQQYPENRERLKMFERFRGELVMTHNEKNEHRCNGCSSCELACPNGTIRIVSKQILLENGKKKKIIDTYIYYLGLCTFCNACVKICPTEALKMSQDFEHAVFDRVDLIKILNKPGSRVEENID